MTLEYKPGRFGHGPAKGLCNDCPLRRVHPSGWLGGYTPEMYIELLHGEADVACHKSKGFDQQEFDKMRSCTGVAIYRKNVGKLPRGINALEAVQAVQKDTEKVFASPQEFLEHHKKGEYKKP